MDTECKSQSIEWAYERHGIVATAVTIASRASVGVSTAGHSFSFSYGQGSELWKLGTSSWTWGNEMADLAS